jgi:tetratricopeptide (TPR) repeat protein
MIARWLLMALSVVNLSPGLVRARPEPGGSGPPSADPSRDPKMYEDIEILRRILDRKLHPLYPRNTYQFPGMMGMGGMGGMVGMQGGIAGMQGGMMGMSGGLTWTEIGHPLEGVYLKGWGVVYTATLSSLQLPGKAETAKPLSEWESVRGQLHNEKEAPKRPDANKPPELSEVLLKVLAENGHHFSRLGDNESLTIVATVRGVSSSSSVRKLAGVSTAPGSQPSAGGGGSDLTSKRRDLELLGDLHLKQGRYDEAIASFLKAVEMDPGPKQAAALRRKLAQCYLGKGQDEKARAELNQAIALLKEVTDGKDKPVPTTKPAVVLPVKLIISAPKKLLDQAKEGKITFEEFRRRAQVEALTFDGHRR